MVCFQHSLCIALILIEKKSCRSFSCNRLLVVTNVASSFTEFEMSCNSECYIFNFKSKGDTFALRHIPAHVRVLNMNNVRMKHVDRWTLEQLPPFVHTVKIANSKKLQQVSVSKALIVVHVKNSNLKRVDIAANSALGELAVSKNELMKIPLDIQNAPHLSSLKVQETKLSEIDLAVFCDHYNLTELIFDSNKIRYVVNTSKRNCSFYNALIKITLFKNMLTTVNMELFNVFVNLKQVDLQMNRITTLSGRLSHHSLEVLAMSMNKLGHVELCDWDVPSMKTVSFSANHLTRLPECITNWTNITKLYFSFNEFTNFSIESVATMNNLEYIELKCNKLTEIMLNSVHFPPSLNNLAIGKNYLTSLNLSYIPVEWLQVSVEYNLIANFDTNNRPPNVRRLIMTGNPIDCSWLTRLEQLYGECIVNGLSVLLRDEEINQCGNSIYRIH